MRDWIARIFPGNRVERLDELASQRKMRSEDAFWSEFQSRASKVRQETPVPRGAPIWLGPALACALLVIVGVGVFWQNREPEMDGMSAQIEVVALGDAVTSYMIWDDQEGRGTMVWLVQDDFSEEGGG